MNKTTHSVTSGSLRVSLLTKGLVRIEFSRTQQFEDRCSLLALNRPAALAFDEEKDLPVRKKIELKSGQLLLRFNKNPQNLDAESFAAFWMDKDGLTMRPLWKPGQVDHRNLGGVHLSMDVVQRGTIPTGVHPAGPGQSINDNRWQIWNYTHRLNDGTTQNGVIGDANSAMKGLFPEEILATQDHKKLSPSFLELMAERSKFPPGILSDAGYYVHDDSQSPLVLRAGEVDEEMIPRAATAGDLDLYLFVYEPDSDGFSEALKSLKTVFGATPLLPKFSLGLWYSRYPTFNQQGCLDTVARFKQEGIPLDMMVMDLEWHQRGWYGFDWDLNHIPDPDGLMQQFQKENIHTTFNVHPGGVPQDDSRYSEFIKQAGLEKEAQDLLKKSKEGKGMTHPSSPTSFIFNEFKMNRPAHHKAYMEALHHPIQDQGLDFWWLDGHAPVDKPMDGYGQFWTNEVYVTHAKHRYPDRRPLTFSRYPGIGAHRYPFHFSGDTLAHFEVLENQVEQTLRAGHMGLSYMTHDIGGHMNPFELLDPELYLRWCQFGFLSPVIRVHSSGGGERRPWMYGNKVMDSFRRGFNWRYSALPYLYTLAFESYTTLMPMCRSNVFVKPEWKEGRDIWDAYYLGDRIYAAPVLHQGTYRKVLLPPGYWMSNIDGRLHHSDGKTPFNQLATLDKEPNHYLEAGRIHLRQTISETPQAGNVSDTLVLDYIWSPIPCEDVFTLYEDDGKSLAHAKGEFSTRQFRCKQSEDGTLVIQIFEAMGNYKTSPQNLEARIIIVGLSSTGEGRSLRLNGSSIISNEADFVTAKSPSLPKQVQGSRFKLGFLNEAIRLEIK